MKKAVLVIVYNEKGEVLLLKRTSDHPLFPNEWCLPGGKLDWIIKGPEAIDIEFLCLMNGEWEEYAAAAYRELKEETGIKGYLLSEQSVFLCDDYYVCKVFTVANPVVSNEVTVKFPNREHVEYGWFDLDALELLPGLGTVTYGLLMQYL